MYDFGIVHQPDQYVGSLILGLCVDLLHVNNLINLVL